MGESMSSSILDSVVRHPERAPIPHILHQTWRSAQLPRPFADWRAAWRNLHPHWQHRFYDDADIRCLIAGRAPWLLSTHDRLPRQIQRVDLFRYLIVFLDGGLYADIDMIPYQTIDPLLDGASCVLCVEHKVRRYRQRRLGYRIPWQLGTSIFAAAPNHPFLAELIERIAEKATTRVSADDDVLQSTGPYMFSRTAYDLPSSRRGAVRILPQITWMPPAEYPRVGFLRRRIYTRHAATGVWRSAPRWVTMWHHLKEWNRWPNPFAVTGPKLPDDEPALAKRPLQ